VRSRVTRVALLACAMVAAGATHGYAASPKSNAVPRSLVGCWSRHVPALPVGTAAGVWLIRIQSTGTFAAYAPGATRCGSTSDFTSRVRVSSGRLTIGHVPICATNGVYMVKAAGSSLALKAVSDRACSARVALLNGTWKRKS
jgi:hypothetical protein